MKAEIAETAATQLSPVPTQPATHDTRNPLPPCRPPCTMADKTSVFARLGSDAAEGEIVGAL